jgi:hypothetical protein
MFYKDSATKVDFQALENEPQQENAVIILLLKGYKNFILKYCLKYEARILRPANPEIENIQLD